MIRVGLLLLACIFGLTGCGSKSTPEGHWVGSLHMGTDSLQRFDVDITRFRDRWIAEVDDANRGVTDYPLGIQFDPGTRRVVLTMRRGVSFEGTIQGDELAGTLDAFGEPTPFHFERRGPSQVSQARLDFESLPAKSARLTVLSGDLGALRNVFNRDRSKVRLVLLLSPT